MNDIRPNSFAAWQAFTRPKTWGVAVAPVIAALALAGYETLSFDSTVAFFTLTIALLMQIVSNMKNDLGYTEKKAETGNRKGLPRATSEGWISVRAARLAIIATIFLALLNTTVLIAFGGWGFALIGISSVIAAYAYMGGPKPIAYTPFGELTVLVFFGLTAVCGTYYLQAHTLSVNAVLLGTALGAVASAVLCINNWRDREHDKSVNRHTLAVVVPETNFLRLITLLIFLPFVLTVVMVILDHALWPTMLVFFALPRALPIPHELKIRQHQALNQTMFACVKLELLVSIAFSIGAVTALLVKIG